MYFMWQSSSTGLCGRISEFPKFSQDIRALSEACTVTEPAGEIRGGLQE